MRPRLLGCFLLTTVLLAACGDGDGGEDAGEVTAPDVTTTVDEDTTVPESGGPGTSELQAGAEAAVLQIGDLPAGWEAPMARGSISSRRGRSCWRAAVPPARPGE